MVFYVAWFMRGRCTTNRVNTGKSMSTHLSSSDLQLPELHLDNAMKNPTCLILSDTSYPLSLCFNCLQGL